jgi:hypothetical protein
VIATIELARINLSLFLFLPNRDGKLKDRATWLVGLRPESTAMSLDDRPADRQPHAHARGFFMMRFRRKLMTVLGYTVQAFSSATEFLKSPASGRGVSKPVDDGHLERCLHCTRLRGHEMLSLATLPLLDDSLAECVPSRPEGLIQSSQTFWSRQCVILPTMAPRSTCNTLIMPTTSGVPSEGAVMRRSGQVHKQTPIVGRPNVATAQTV